MFFIFKNLFLSIILYFEYRVIVGLAVNIQKKFILIILTQVL